MKLVNSCSISEKCSSWHVVQPENGKLLIFCSCPSCEKKCSCFHQDHIHHGGLLQKPKHQITCTGLLNQKNFVCSQMARKTHPAQSAHKVRTHCVNPIAFGIWVLTFRLHFQTERKRQLPSQKTWCGGMGFETSAPS